MRVTLALLLMLAVAGEAETCPTSPCAYAAPPQSALGIPPCTFPASPVKFSVTSCNYVDTCDVAAVAAAGVDAILIDLNWATFDARANITAPPVWNAAAWAPVAAHIDAAVAAGLRVLIGTGAHVPPQYIWDAGARFVNAGGQTYTPDADAWPNFVFYTELRVFVTQYFVWLGQQLANATAAGHIAALRLGGGHYGELSYPRGGPDGGVYWSFDERAAALNPVPHWRPGQPAPNNEALAFLTWYLASLEDYQNFQAAAAGAAFPGVPLGMLYPGGEADYAAVGAAVAAGLPQTQWDAVTAGQVRVLLAPSLARTAPLGVVWCTSVSGGGSAANLGPMAAVSSAVGLARGGENVGGVDGAADMLVSFGMARRNELTFLMWLPPHTPAEPGNLTSQLPLIGALARAAAAPATLCGGDNSSGLAAPGSLFAPSLGSFLALGSDASLSLVATNVSDVAGLRGAVLWSVGPLLSAGPFPARAGPGGASAAAVSLVVNETVRALQLVRTDSGSVLWQCAGPAAATVATGGRTADACARGGSARIPSACGGGGGEDGLFLTLTDAASLRLYSGSPAAPGLFVDVSTCR